MPSTATDRLQGLTTSVAVKAPVVAVATSNITLNGLQTVGGVALAEGDRVLVGGQTSGVDNGVYDASTSDWTRSVDADGSLDMRDGTTVYVAGGSGEGWWVITAATSDITPGTTSMTMSRALGAIDSSSVAHTHSGTGAAATNVQTRLRKTYRSSDYDTIQHALTAAAANVLVIEPGAYSMGSTQLTVPAGTTVTAYGATLTWSGIVTGVTFTGSTTLRSAWFGGTLEGPDGATYNGSGVAKAMYMSGTDYDPAATPPDYILGARIRDVTIHGWGFAGIWHEYTEYMDIQHCHVYLCGYVGIAGISSRYCTTDHNTIHDIDGDTAPDRYGAFYSAHESNETAHPRSIRSSMSHNIVYNVPRWEALDIHGDTDIDISSNTIYNCKYGIMVGSGDYGAVQSTAPKRVTVNANIIYCNNNGNAVTIHGAAGTPEYATGIVVSNNTITNGGFDNDPVEGCIRAYYVNDMVVCGNTIIEPYTNGIHLSHEIRSAEVYGNIIQDPQASVTATPACIYVSSNNVAAHIHGNTFRYSGNAGLNTHVAVKSIYEIGGLTGLNIKIGENQFIGIDATHLTATTSSAGVTTDGMYSESGGATALAAGAKTVTFTKRFPATPKVFVTCASALNPVRAHTVTTTQFEVAGTGTDTFYWTATT